MPALNSEVVLHTTQTDHRVIRKPNSPQATPRGALTSFEEPGFKLSDVESARARGLMLIRMAEGRANQSLAAEFESLLRH